jgi:hypothetical protein
MVEKIAVAWKLPNPGGQGSVDLMTSLMLPQSPDERAKYPLRACAATPSVARIVQPYPLHGVFNDPLLVTHAEVDQFIAEDLDRARQHYERQLAAVRAEAEAFRLEQSDETLPPAYRDHARLTIYARRVFLRAVKRRSSADILDLEAEEQRDNTSYNPPADDRAVAKSIRTMAKALRVELPRSRELLPPQKRLENEG